MWRLAVLCVVACGGSPVKRKHVPEPEPRPPLRLVFAPATPGVEVTSAAELEAAFASGRTPTAALDEIVEVKWGERTLDREAIREIVEGYPNYPVRNALRERYGIDYDGVLRVVLYGYAAQLAERFGIEPHEVWAGPDNGELRIGVRGRLGARAVDWKTGTFSISNVTLPPPRPARVPNTVETIITSDRGDYYHVKDLGLAYFRPSDAPTNADKVHRGAVLRSYVEPVEFVDAKGTRLARELEVTRATPYVTSRPGGLPHTGLAKSIHLVRLELDGSAVGGSATIIESVTVLDGTPAFPADLETAHRAVWQRYYEPEARAAERAVADDAKATLAAFDARATEWAKQVQSTGHVESSQRQYVHSNPTYTWDAYAKTLTITFNHETHVIHTRTVRYPNPARQHFHCPPGRACAVPPDTLAHGLELEYVIAFGASYRIDGDGRITATRLSRPRLDVVP